MAKFRKHKTAKQRIAAVLKWADHGASDMNIAFLLNAFVVVFSLFAGWFWMLSALGFTFELPWKDPHRVEPAELPAYQSRWNGRAASCAALAAVFQALLFLYNSPPLWRLCATCGT